MNCDQALLLMQKETLTPDEQEALLAHLESCPECENIYELTRLTDEAVASLAVEAPEMLVSDTMWKIAPDYMEQKTGRKPARRFHFAGTAIAAVAAAALLVVGLTQLNKAPREESVSVPTYASYVEDGTEAVEYGTTAMLESKQTAATDAAEPVESSAFAPTEQVGSCLAVMDVADSSEEIQLGERIIEKMPVNDLRAWVGTTFGVPEGKLSRVQAESGDVSLLTLSRDELENLQENFPEQVEVLEEDSDWDSCTLVIFTEETE